MRPSSSLSVMRALAAALALAAGGGGGGGVATAFYLAPAAGGRAARMIPSASSSSALRASSSSPDDDASSSSEGGSGADSRRAFLSSAAAASAAAFSPLRANADEGGKEGGESIVARAARISRQISAEEEEEGAAEDARQSAARERLAADKRTVYDFTLPVQGRQVPFDELVRQEYAVGGEEGTRGEPKVKAVLVVNIKQDDPLARKNIPELIALASKFGRSGEFAVVCCPTDQGYYEPDTSALLRLKLASEYGYGINPATVVTDKVNLLGTGAHPFWRWIQGRVRTPSGLGRIQANFEKFLVDGRTGLPVRRYPRKYMPYDMQEDVEALVRGKPLPPVTADWREEWRAADRDAERDTYRFQKGLNVFDQ